MLFSACGFFIVRFPLSAFRFPLSAFRFPLSALPGGKSTVCNCRFGLVLSAFILVIFLYHIVSKGFLLIWYKSCIY